MENSFLTKRWNGQQEGETRRTSNIRDILKYNFAVIVAFGGGMGRGELIDASLYKEQIKGRKANYKINIH